MLSWGVEDDLGRSPHSKNAEGFHSHQRFSIDEEIAERFLMQFEWGQMGFTCEINYKLKLRTKRRFFQLKFTRH